MYPSCRVSIAAVITGSVTSQRCNKINGKIAQVIGVKGELSGWEMFVLFAVPLYM